MAQLAQDTMSGEVMGAGDNKRAAEARKVSEEKKQREAQAKQQSATDKAVKEEQLVEKFARIVLETKGKAARFQESHDKVLRLVRNRGVVDKETISILAGVIASAVEAEDTEANRELRVNTGLLGRAENLGTQIIFTAEDNAKEVPLSLITRWAGKTSAMSSRDPRIFSIPKPSAEGPQRVAITIDTVTSVEFISNLTVYGSGDRGGAFCGIF